MSRLLGDESLIASGEDSQENQCVICCYCQSDTLSYDERIEYLIYGFIKEFSNTNIPTALIQIFIEFVGDQSAFDPCQLLNRKELKQWEIKQQMHDPMYNFGDRHWPYGLFNCTDDMASCLYVLCCPLYAAGEIYDESKMGNFFTGCLSCCFCSFIYPCMFTSRIRKNYGIKGSIWMDMLFCYGCGCCQLCRELRIVRDNPPPNKD